MTPEQAIDLVALDVIAGGACDRVAEGWENYPDLGEHDWQRVAEAVERLAPDPDPTLLDEAYALLEGRAEE